MKLGPAMSWFKLQSDPGIQSEYRQYRKSSNDSRFYKISNDAAAMF